MAKNIKKTAAGRNALQVGETLFGDDVLRVLSLKDTYGVDPFSILDSRQGRWQERKKWWLSKGIRSEEGRVEGLAYGQAGAYMNRMEEAKNPNLNRGDDPAIEKGTSIFDATLCEIMYRWFAFKGAKVLDPFAGGSVRGIVANYLGLKYTGCELRAEQVESNILQGRQILPGNEPVWLVGDSAKVIPAIPETFDYIFTCPPYMDLEVYSDHPDDLSNMTDNEFTTVYEEIIKKAVDKLNNNRFATIVIGDVRAEDGFYKDFVTITKQAFYKAGMRLYNDAVLLNHVGTGAMRAGKPMMNRKLTKMHQNVLVFFKGNPAAIKETFNRMHEEEEIAEIEQPEAPPEADLPDYLQPF